MIVLSETNTNAPTTQVPCVKKLLRSPIRRTCAEPRRSCVAAMRKKRRAVLSPMVAQANSPRMPCQEETASVDALERLTSHFGAQPKFHSQTNSTTSPLSRRREKVPKKSHISRTFLRKIWFGLCLIYRKVDCGWGDKRVHFSANSVPVRGRGWTRRERERDWEGQREIWWGSSLKDWHDFRRDFSE